MEGDKPPKVRKSLLAECARNSGVSFNSCDVESFLQDFPRLSNTNKGGPSAASAWQERRASGQGARVVVETPVNRGLASSSQSSASSIPRRLMGASSATQLPQLSRLSQKPPPSSATGSTARGRNPVKSKGPPTSGAKPWPASGAPRLRRSTSMESFSQNNSHSSVFSLITPRNRSQSPGPGSASATKGKGEVSKTLKLPGSQDKQVLNTMATYIVECLADMKYVKSFTVKQFQMLSAKDFYSICGFLLAYFVGPKDDKIEDSTYIMDGLKLLDYPGSVSKSHFKTPNTPHSLPTTYTIVAWLCNMVEVFMRPDDVEGYEARMNQEEELQWDSYLRLFYQYHSENAVVAEEELMNNVKAELVNYRDSLSEFRHPNPVPQEQLLEEIRNKEIEKQALLAKRDPRNDIMDVIRTQQELIAKSKRRITELTELKQKYSNINALETEWHALNNEFKRHQSTRQTLVQQIATQAVNPASAEKLKADTDKARKEKEMLDKLIQDLKLKVERQKQFLKNDETRFYDECRQFSVLESYNSAAKGWGILPVISQNPLDAVALDVWLNEAVKKLGIAQKRMEEYDTDCREKCERLTKEIEDMAVKCEAYKEMSQKLTEEIRTKLSQECETSEILDTKIVEAENELATLKATFATAEKDSKDSKEQYEQDVAEIAKYEPFLKELQEYSSELDAHIEKQFCVTQLANLEMETTLMAIVIDARTRINAPLWELDDPNYGKEA